MKPPLIARRRTCLVLSWLAWLCLVLPAGQVTACGPFFPNMLLVGGDAPVLERPVGRFRVELDRMEHATPVFQSRVPTNGYTAQTLDADLDDLRAALLKRGTPTEKIQTIIDSYQSVRSTLQSHSDALAKWELARTNPPANVSLTPRPILQVNLNITGLPPEFADYLKGAAAWHDARTNDARVAWQSLLQRPASERYFKSTWAAFMLGKSWAGENPSKAIDYYHQVRSLADAGFADRLGLAASTIGWEARVALDKKNYQHAMELYLDQLATGDDTAYNSLKFAARDALLDNHSPLKALAKTPQCQRVITAYLISEGYGLGPIDNDGPVKEAMIDLVNQAPLVHANTTTWHTMRDPGLLWLEAVESGEVRDVDAAEKFALAAYQIGDFELAQRWIDHSSQTPLTLWLQAKLNLRAGKVTEAAVLLTKLSHRFPVDASVTNQVDKSFYISTEPYYPQIPPSRQVLGELGVVQLARRDYVESLDCLFRAGFWFDAAYVAERVLTVEELKAYVDRHWSGTNLKAPLVATSDASSLESTTPAQLRYLLGRRLLRLHRDAEARLYFPVELQTAFDQFSQFMADGHNPALTEKARANALWEAAKLARQQGMELLGTEVAPDWAVYGGAYEGGPDIRERSITKSPVMASRDEVQRATSNKPTPDTRFHYRYIAADLAWEAAKLMPNDSDDTARVLCQAGTWLKDRDPKSADVFYKALVRRCGGTELGMAADCLRWFPKVVEKGNPPPASNQ